MHGQSRRVADRYRKNVRFGWRKRVAEKPPQMADTASDPVGAPDIRTEGRSAALPTVEAAVIKPDHTDPNMLLAEEQKPGTGQPANGSPAEKAPERPVGETGGLAAVLTQPVRPQGRPVAHVRLLDETETTTKTAALPKSILVVTPESTQPKGRARQAVRPGSQPGNLLDDLHQTGGLDDGALAAETSEDPIRAVGKEGHAETEPKRRRRRKSNPSDS